jgi:hypothetical protein
MSELFSLQHAFTAHLRDPDTVPVPAGVDGRRMGIYSDLIFNNVSALLSDFFPVINSLLTEEQWRVMVRNFFISHHSQTPYFMELSGEFVNYLSQRQLTGDLPDFLTELAHYEWIELAIYTMDHALPDKALPERTLGESGLALTPLAQPLAYQYPVHQIRPDFQPDEPGEQPTYLLVFRDESESVRFFELQPLSFHLLHDIQQNPGLVPGEWLQDKAADLGFDDSDTFIRNGLSLLASFNEKRLLTEEQDETT